MSVNEGKPMTVKVDDGGTAGIHFDMPFSVRKKFMLLEVTLYDTIENYERMFAIVKN